MATFMALKYPALDDIKDPDLKRELASGQTQLISYSEV